jgi:hypothetical protein
MRVTTRIEARNIAIYTVHCAKREVKNGNTSQYSNQSKARETNVIRAPRELPMDPIEATSDVLCTMEIHCPGANLGYLDGRTNQTWLR